MVNRSRPDPKYRSRNRKKRAVSQLVLPVAKNSCLVFGEKVCWLIKGTQVVRYKLRGFTLSSHKRPLRISPRYRRRRPRNLKPNVRVVDCSGDWQIVYSRDLSGRSKQHNPKTKPRVHKKRERD